MSHSHRIRFHLMLIRMHLSCSAAMESCLWSHCFQCCGESLGPEEVRLCPFDGILCPPPVIYCNSRSVSLIPRFSPIPFFLSLPHLSLCLYISIPLSLLASFIQYYLHVPLFPYIYPSICLRVDIFFYLCLYLSILGLL